MHLIEAIERRPDAFSGEPGWVLRRRLHALRRWGRVRAAVMVFLYFGILATVGAWILRYIPQPEPAQELIDQVTALASALTGLLTLLAIFFTRLLGQIEMDIIALLCLEIKKSKFDS